MTSIKKVITALNKMAEQACIASCVALLIICELYDNYFFHEYQN